MDQQHPTTSLDKSDESGGLWFPCLAGVNRGRMLVTITSYMALGLGILEIYELTVAGYLATVAGWGLDPRYTMVWKHPPNSSFFILFSILLLEF